MPFKGLCDVTVYHSPYYVTSSHARPMGGRRAQPGMPGMLPPDQAASRSCRNSILTLSHLRAVGNIVLLGLGIAARNPNVNLVAEERIRNPKGII